MQRDICLNMIVKNEAHVIERCLASVKPHITSWCIVDTGSTDGTQDKIRAFLADLPGELIERPWVDEEHNRNEALGYALERNPKPDYIFWIDADEVLRPMVKHATWPLLELDQYDIVVHYDALRYTRLQLLSAKFIWRWVSVGKRCKFHPGLLGFGAVSRGTIATFETVPTPDGASWKDPDKYKKLLPLIELDIADEPDNPRLLFYAAQTCKDAGLLHRALQLYKRRMSMAGWPEESFMAALEYAKVYEMIHGQCVEVYQHFRNAHEFRPCRAEPFYHAARVARVLGKPLDALVYAAAGLAIPKPNDQLFVEHAVYDWQLLMELAVAQRSLGLTAAAQETFAKIDMSCVHEGSRHWLFANRAFIFGA